MANINAGFDTLKDLLVKYSPETASVGSAKWAKVRPKHVVNLAVRVRGMQLL
jgi:hypothetical protein